MKHVTVIKLLFYALVLLIPLYPSAVIGSDTVVESNDGPYSADVSNISGQQYFPAVKEAIAGAQKSIKVVMFVITLTRDANNSQPQQLVDALVLAKKRGVEVEVVLDRNFDFVGQQYKNKSQEQVKSIRAYKRLKEEGIAVYYDKLSTYTHAKAIVIDEQTVILGSTNWTQSSLNRNIEANVLIKSEELAKSVLAYFNKIELAVDIDTLPTVAGNCIPITFGFINDVRLAPEMMKRHDERAFDAYLFLLNVYDGNHEASITLFYDNMAECLGMGNMSTTGYRRQIIRTMRKLEDKYKLIKFNPRYAKEAQITLLDYKNHENTYSLPKADFFGLPAEYFDLGWNRRLSMRAKFCYLVNLLNTRKSDSGPFWSKNVTQITKDFGDISKYVIQNGMGELRRKRLLEVEYGDLTYPPYAKRSPKIYRLLSLYDFDELAAELDGLKQKYGRKTFKRALAYAEIVFEEYNPRVIEDIINKEKEYGKATLKRAFDIVAQKNTDNPKKSYVYVLGILEQWGK